MLAVKFSSHDTARRVNKRHGYTTPKKDGDVRNYFLAQAKKATADPLPFALETMLWQSALFMSHEFPSAMTDACKIYGIDLEKIKAAAKEKPMPQEFVGIVFNVAGNIANGSSANAGAFGVCQHPVKVSIAAF